MGIQFDALERAQHAASDGDFEQSLAYSAIAIAEELQALRTLMVNEKMLRRMDALNFVQCVGPDEAMAEVRKEIELFLEKFGDLSKLIGR